MATGLRKAERCLLVCVALAKRQGLRCQAASGTQKANRTSGSDFMSQRPARSGQLTSATSKSCLAAAGLSCLQL